jgi:hypothetical protein
MCAKQRILVQHPKRGILCILGWQTCNSAAMKAEHGVSALFHSALSVGVLSPQPSVCACMPAESAGRLTAEPGGGGSPARPCGSMCARCWQETCCGSEGKIDMQTPVVPCMCPCCKEEIHV